MKRRSILKDRGNMTNSSGDDEVTLSNPNTPVAAIGGATARKKRRSVTFNRSMTVRPIAKATENPAPEEYVLAADYHQPIYSVEESLEPNELGASAAFQREAPAPAPAPTPTPTEDGDNGENEDEVGSVKMDSPFGTGSVLELSFLRDSYHPPQDASNIHKALPPVVNLPSTGNISDLVNHLDDLFVDEVENAPVSPAACADESNFLEQFSLSFSPSNHPTSPTKSSNSNTPSQPAVTTFGLSDPLSQLAIASFVGVDDPSSASAANETPSASNAVSAEAKDAPMSECKSVQTESVARLPRQQQPLSSQKKKQNTSNKTTEPQRNTTVVVRPRTTPTKQLFFPHTPSNDVIAGGNRVIRIPAPPLLEPMGVDEHTHAKHKRSSGTADRRFLLQGLNTESRKSIPLKPGISAASANDYMGNFLQTSKADFFKLPTPLLTLVDIERYRNEYNGRLESHVVADLICKGESTKLDDYLKLGDSQDKVDESLKLFGKKSSLEKRLRQLIEIKENNVKGKSFSYALKTFTLNTWFDTKQAQFDFGGKVKLTQFFDKEMKVSDWNSEVFCNGPERERCEQLVSVYMKRKLMEGRTVGFGVDHFIMMFDDNLLP